MCVNSICDLTNEKYFYKRVNENRISNLLNHLEVGILPELSRRSENRKMKLLENLDVKDYKYDLNVNQLKFLSKLIKKSF